MTPQTLFDDFVLPLYRGGEVRLGLPTRDGFHSQLLLLADREIDDAVAPVRPVIERMGREIWAGLPQVRPGVELLDVAAAIHDTMVPLHRFGADGLAESYTKHLVERVKPRVARWRTDDPVALVVRHTLASAALRLQRRDHVVRLGLLGELKGYGREPRWVRFPWRRVVDSWSQDVTARQALTVDLRSLLWAISPVTAAESATELADFRVLTPLLTHTPLARHLVHCLQAQSLYQRLASWLSGDLTEMSATALRRWCGLVLYLHIERPDAARSGAAFWATLVASLLPHAAELGAPPDLVAPPRAPENVDFRDLLVRAQLAGHV